MCVNNSEVFDFLKVTENIGFVIFSSGFLNDLFLGERLENLIERKMRWMKKSNMK